MTDPQSEDFILQLANLPGSAPGHKEPRRVATPQGAQFYGQPIGTIITADLLAKIHAEKGSAPKGATAPVKQSGAAQIGSKSYKSDPAIGNGSASAPGGSAPSTGGSPAGQPAGSPTAGNIYTQHSYPAPNIDSTPPEWVTNPPAPAPAPQMALGIKPSSIDGPNKFTVGSSSYNAPQGSRLVRPKSGSAMAIVITPDNDIHFFTDKGEVESDETIKQVLQERFGKKVKPDDTLYTEEDFDAVNGLDTMQVGQHLHDKQGNKIFTKTETGFVHSDLGIPVDAKDIKPLHDSGELSTHTAPVAEEDVTPDFGNDSENEISFAAMSAEEFKAYLDTTDPGDTLYYPVTAVHATNGDPHNSKEGPQEFKTVIKQPDGKWQVEGAKSQASPDTLSFIRKDLRTIKPKDLQPHGTWSSGEKQKEDEKATAQKVKDDAATAKQAEKDAAQKVKDTAKAKEDAAAESLMAELRAEHKAEKAAKDAALQKDVDQALTEHAAFEKEKSALSDYFKKRLESQKLGEIAGPWFRSLALPGSRVYLSEFKSTWEREDEPGKWRNLETGQVLHYSDLMGNKPGVYVAKNTFNGDEEWKPEELKIGDAPTEDWMNQADIGSVISHSSAKNPEKTGYFQKKDNGLWGTISNDEGFVDPHDMQTVLKTWKIDKAPSEKEKKSQPAGTVASYDDVLNSPNDTPFHYHKLDGTTSNYLKIDDNTILMPGGIEQPILHWKKSIDDGKVTFADNTQEIVHPDGTTEMGAPPETPTIDMPEPLVDPTGDKKHDAKAYEDHVGELHDWEKELLAAAEEDQMDESDPLAQEQYLDSLPEHSEVSVVGKYGLGTEYFEKNGTEWYELTDENLENPFSSEELVANGTVSLDSKGRPEQPLDKSIAQAVEDSQTPSILLGIGGMPKLTPEQVWGAIDALENHSHGSPVYGLKSLPDDNPIKQHQAEVIDLAQKLWPKHKPKAAVLALLKAQVTPIDDVNKLDEANNPTIHLGKAKPAKNAFGVTGGDFTQSDIESAIGIIEGYDGKLYKSQLTKKDNPLGELDFNTLVGPNKDKLQQKKDVVDFLKKQVNDLKPVETTSISDVTGETSTALPLQFDDLEKLPAGAETFYTNSGGNKLTFKKNKDGYWDASNSGMGTDWSSKDLADEAAYNSSDVQLVEKTNLQELTSADFKNLPVGSKILVDLQATKNTITLEKSKSGEWISPGGQKVSDGILDGMVKHGHVHLLSTPEPTINSNHVIQDMNEFHNLPIGAKVSENDEGTGIYAKIGNNEWEFTAFDMGDSQLSDDDFSASISEGWITLISTPDSTPAQYVAPPALQSKTDEDGNGPKEQLAHSYTPGYYVNSVTKQSVSIFADGTGAGALYSPIVENFTPEQIAQYDLNGPSWSWNGIPNNPPAFVKDKPAKKISKPSVKINPKDIPNGVYYTGNPGNDDTDTWEVTDGKVFSWNANDDVSPAKLKTAVLKGQLVDKWGNTKVLSAEGNGKVKFFNQETNVESLKQLRIALDNPDFSIGVTNSDKALLAQFGVHADMGSISTYMSATHGPIHNEADVKESLKSAIDGMLGDPSTYPFKDLEAESMNNFNWIVGTGMAQFPAQAVTHFPNEWSWSKSNSEAKKAIDDISKNFGDGETIGRHSAGMDVTQKRSWLKAFQDGNFAKMYQFEVFGAIKQGKSHDSGWKHPGNPNSPLTNHINWGPSVKGEVPASADVPGNWSNTDDVSWSSIGDDEIDNYLLAANMQNPTHLTKLERRQWVEMHRNKNSWVVNALSVKAQQSALSGETSITLEPIWSDDVKPAKIYNGLFASTPYPTSWAVAPQGAVGQWITDFQHGEVGVKGINGKDLSYDKDFMPVYQQVKIDNPYSNQNVLNYMAVSQFFSNLNDSAELEASKPVYSLAPTQNVKKSLHPIFNVVDQHGNKYLFKPAAQDPAGKKYRAEVEAEANNISRFFGARAPASKVIQFNGSVGSLQAEVPHIKTLSGFSWKTADEKQTIDLAHEHLVDWMLDQDDNWAPNTLIDGQGHLVGIDKGRSFINYGAWNGMVSHSGMDVNTHLVYSDLYQGIIDHSISKEIADATWLATQRRAKKMSQADDGRLLELLHAATDNRKTWQVSYSIDGKKLPNTQQGFLDAFFDRKSKLPQQVEDLWKDIYTKAGYGDLPEPKTAFLGEKQHSGLDDPNLHSTALFVGSVGTSTLLGSHDVIGGTATMWGHKNSDGSKDMNVQMYLAPKKQADTLAWFKANSDASSLSTDNAAPGEFTHDDKYAPFIAAAKTVGSHSEDGAYNQSTLQTYNSAKDALTKDQEFWKPGMLPEGDADFIQFPSGNKIEFGQVDQYKMMLDYYAGKTDIIDSALASKSKPAETIKKFEPIDLDQSNVIYLDGNGQKLVKLSNGKWVYSNSNITAIIDNAEAESYYKDPGQVWTKWKDQPESPKVVFKAILGSTHEKEGEYKDFELTLSGKHLSGGNNGNEYEVSLPTGEKIYFRNSKNTNTVRGQEGRITIRVPSAKNETDVATGMANAQSWLEDNLGLHLDAADHDNAELIYWREMYGVLENRSHKAGSKWAKAKADLDKKIAEIGGNSSHFLENFAEKYSVSEQNDYFRDLWSTHFGKEKVNEMLFDEKYLPYYENHDLRDTNLITGKPNWLRFDVDLEELKAKDMMLASRAQSGTHALDVVKSGGAYSTEERSRLFGKWITGMSSGTDQSYGSSNSIFSRIFPSSQHSGLSFVYNPRAMLRTRTYSFNSDNYGRLDNRKTGSPSNPLDAWGGFAGGSNETMLPNAAGLFGDLDLVIFDDAQLLNTAIQELKKLGITEIRGVPVEDRLVIRNKLNAAIQKLKESWYKK